MKKHRRILSLALALALSLGVMAVPGRADTVTATEFDGNGNVVREWIIDTEAGAATPVETRPTAYESVQTVSVDGKPVEFRCYALKDESGNGIHYIKLRDLAAILNGTPVQFQVGWDGGVTIATKTAYTPDGSEGAVPFSGDRPYEEPTAATKVDGQAADLAAFVLYDDQGGGYTYYKLRDLAAALGFHVDWSAQQGISIETGANDRQTAEEAAPMLPSLHDFGVTRAAVVAELAAHQNDTYYLGTPYRGYDWQSPNGDPSYNNAPGMNCGGFVSYVLRKCGLNADAVLSLLQNKRGFGSGKPYDKLARASSWYRFAVNSGVTVYHFSSKADLLTSGVLEKGDVIVMWSDRLKSGEDNHIGFFWGDTPNQDLLWHSGTRPYQGNQLSPITPLAEKCTFTVIKLEATAASGK